MSKGYVTYDPESDILYVGFFPRETAVKTKPLDDLRLIDYSADGSVMGIEFIDASEGVDLEDVPFAPTIEQLIGQSGYDIKIFA